MYESKGRGRAASTVYAGVAHDPLERLSLSRRLRRAIARGELVLHYQPIVWTASGRLHSMEALLRWNDPERGLVFPEAFIPAAEEMGLIDPIGAWVIDALAAQLAEWQAQGVQPRVSFNVSPRELHRPDFAADLGERLRNAGADPSLLTMELTESATLREPERIGPLLRDLRALGLQLAIDDFGAGWSSLSRLRSLPVQILKIDRSFLREIPDDPEAGAIVRAVIALSDALGRTTIAEGVELPVQQHFLAAQGCPLVAGPPVRRRAAAGRDDRAAARRADLGCVSPPRSSPAWRWRRAARMSEEPAAPAGSFADLTVTVDPDGEGGKPARRATITLRGAGGLGRVPSGRTRAAEGVRADARQRRLHAAVRRAADGDGGGHAARRTGQRRVLARQRLRDRALARRGPAPGRGRVSWRVTVRNGPRVERQDAATLAEALDLLETEARAAATTTRRGTIDVRVRRFEPGDQVAVRAELRGPGVRAGFDVRGDGAVQAWTGRVRRRLVEPEGGETPFEALRRAVQSTSVEP